MPLPPPQPRELAHTRTAVYRGYRREDGLWDIEGELTDVKTHSVHKFDGHTLEAGDPAHHMSIRATIDEKLVIREIASTMDAMPMAHCLNAIDPMQKMVGVTMGAGWRRAIDEALGRERGCTHLRELLFNMATAAMQTISGSYMQKPLSHYAQAIETSPKPPAFLGQCLNWGYDSPSVKAHFPTWFGRRPAPRADKG